MPLAAAQDYPLWVNLSIFVVAAACVWVGGTRLTRILDRLADATGLDAAFIGILLLGGITSLPEVANCITSALIDNPALAVNNLLGSAAINILLLAIGDAVIGREALTTVAARPSTLMLGTACMIVLALVAAAITTGDVATGGVGLWSMALFAVSLAAFWLCSGYDRRARWTLETDGAQAEPATVVQDDPDHPPLRTLAAGAAAAGAFIFVAGYALAQTGDALAEQTGLGTGMVGFALVGVSTSLPELSTIVTALRLGRPEMAIGNVLGTNFINVALILLVDGVASGGPVIDRLGGFEVLSALLGAILAGIVVIGLLERRNPAVLRMGYDSLAVMIVFAAGLALLATLS